MGTNQPYNECPNVIHSLQDEGKTRDATPANNASRSSKQAHAQKHQNAIFSSVGQTALVIDSLNVHGKHDTGYEAYAASADATGSAIRVT